MTTITCKPQILIFPSLNPKSSGFLRRKMKIVRSGKTQKYTSALDHWEERG
jgi:hypothetical protein